MVASQLGAFPQDEGETQVVEEQAEY